MNRSSALGGISGAFRHRYYRYFWIGIALSNVGRWMYVLAVGWLTWALTQSTTWLGAVGFAATFPTVIFSLHAGVIADRIGYLRVTRICMFSVALMAALFAFLTFTGLISPPLILLLSAAVGSALALSMPAQISLVHPLVPKEDLPAAIALGSATFNAARFVGPMLGGVLVVWAGTAAVLATYAGAVFIYFLILLRIRITEMPRRESAAAGMIAEIMESVRFVLGHPGIYFLLAVLCAVGLLIRPVMELLPGFAAEVFGRGAEGLSVLMSATGAGAIISGLWLARRGLTAGLTALVTLSLLASALGLLAFALSGNIWLATFCLSIVGAFILVGNVGSQTLIQSVVEPRIRARVLSLFIVISWGFPALGALLEGWLASHFGLGPVIGWGAVIALGAWVWARPRLAGATRSLEEG